MIYRPSLLHALLAAACALQASAAPLQSIGKSEGQLNIIAWPGYLERGETDKNYDWLTGFEQASGCKVKVKTASNSDEMVRLMNQGGYDLVTASGDASLRLIYGRKVQEINTGLLPSWARIDPRLQQAAWHTVEGKHYGVPYQWGPNVLMYSTKVFKQAPKSWSVVFEPQKLPDGKPNKGRVQAYDGAIYIADAALYLMSKKPALGIKDPYELNEKQYAEVLKLLRGQKALVQRYWHDVTLQMNDFKQAGIAASSAWPFQVNGLQAEKQAVASTIPDEGATGWADSTMLHASAKNLNCAYKWLEHSLSIKTQASVAEWFGSLPAVPAACKEKAPAGSNFCQINGIERFNQIKFWKTPQGKCASQGVCVPYSHWAEDYQAIMDGR